jgi:hypothetical protein
MGFQMDKVPGVFELDRMYGTDNRLSYRMYSCYNLLLDSIVFGVV